MTKLDDNYLQQLKNTILSRNCTGELEFESLDSIRSVCLLTTPRNILELDFNRGISTIMFLESSNANVHSIDIRLLDEVKASIDYINTNYQNRFEYTSLNHHELYKKKYIDKFKNYYDLIFIDGDHSYDAIYRDTENCLKFNPKYILFDDYNHPAHGQDVKNIIQIFDLDIMQEYLTTCGHVLTKNKRFESE